MYIETEIDFLFSRGEGRGRGPAREEDFKLQMKKPRYNTEYCKFNLTSYMFSDSFL